MTPNDRRRRMTGALQTLVEARRETDEQEAQGRPPGHRYRTRTILLAIAGLALALAIGVEFSKMRFPAPGPAIPGPPARPLATPTFLDLQERMQIEHAKIQKRLRTDDAFEAHRLELDGAARTISGLAAASRGDAIEPSKHGMTPAQWAAETDALISASDAFGNLATDPAATRMQAKAAFQKLTAACSSCHRQAGR